MQTKSLCLESPQGTPQFSQRLTSRMLESIKVHPYNPLKGIGIRDINEQKTIKITCILLIL
jgi:hypothetical protein